MYSLNCKFYNKKFSTIDELINDVINSGTDPSYDITFNDKNTGEQAIELIQF